MRIIFPLLKVTFMALSLFTAQLSLHGSCHFLERLFSVLCV